MGAVLRAVEVPEHGGDTLWADMACAYDNLPIDVRDRIDDLRALHSFIHVFGYGMSEEKRARMLEEYPPVEHPVVRIHPETGEKVLYVNSVFTRRIKDLDPFESDRLLARLLDQFKRPEFQVRWSWRPGSVAFWDNRATQHYAVPDFTEPRHM